MRLIAVLTVLAVAAVPAVCQDMPKPGPEHEWLKKMEGTWDVTLKMGGADSKGSVTYKMELGGLWLSSTLESEMFGAKFTGKGMDGYDPEKKKFVSLWADSMSAAPVISEGTYDKEKKTLTMDGHGPGMDRKTTKYKSVTVYKDDNSFTMTMYMGDGKEPAFSVEYKRKK